MSKGLPCAHGRLTPDLVSFHPPFLPVRSTGLEPGNLGMNWSTPPPMTRQVVWPQFPHLWNGDCE